MDSKGQTSTEYLIILAVVVVIALIVVGVKGEDVLHYPQLDTVLCRVIGFCTPTVLID